MTVLGTAGHVDHGKTTLVHALTGVDTDRLPEEKRRGITIELGFAPLVLTDPDGSERTVAVVDVPGHERFVGTMVAGAQGVDAALLVVAADAGVMPQTREHLLVLAALGVESLVVALTRADLVDEEMRALSTVDVEEALAATPWPKAPIVVVSARTGEGLDALRTTLAAATRRLDLGPRRDRPSRLAIDRAFAPRGQGVVVTGTLVAGRLTVGEELALLPSDRRVRVRGLHQHGRPVDTVTATARVALSLSGVELAELHRGETLAAPGTLLVTRAFDAILQRARGGRPFGRRARMAFHVGTAEVSGRLVPIAPLSTDEARTTIGGGETWLVRAVLQQPAALAVGDRVVVRADGPLASVGTTLGSLRVLRPSPGRLVGGRARHAAALRELIEADDVARARFEVEAAGLAGLDAASLRLRLPTRALSKDLTRALTPLELRAGSTVRWVGVAARSRAEDALLAQLRRHHAAHPDEDGAPLAAVLSAVPANAAEGLAEAALAKAVAERRVHRSSDRVRLEGFVARARADDPQALAMAEAFATAGLSPPTMNEVATSLGLEVPRARALGQALAAAGKIVHVQGDLWFDAQALDALRAKVVELLRRQPTMTTGEFKELVGASRKFVVPLAEWLDARKVTLRVGDVRKLRG